MAKPFLHMCALLILCGFVGCGSQQRSATQATQSSPTATAVAAPALQPIAAGSAPALMVDAPASGFPYAYGPSIVKTSDGTYHMWFCSTGDGSNIDWDDIRHSVSSDLTHWSAPEVALVPTSYERSNCDPSVVFNQADGYFYLYYGANVPAAQTVVFVARSQSASGPWLKWSGSDWEQNPATSAIVIAPINPTTNTKFYGAGQPSVAIHNGVWYMWSDDDTGNGSTPESHTYFETSFDGLSWSAPTVTNVATGTNSVDVKWDASRSEWLMVEIVNQFAGASLVSQTSTDGVNWDAPVTLQAAGGLPAGANNPGISGDAEGNLIAGQTLIAYGAPYAPATVNATTGMAGPWGQWDMWGSITTVGGAQ